jgi:hypothetical protein
VRSASVIGPAGDGPQAVRERHHQGQGGDRADHDRAQTMAHEPQADRSGIEDEGAERDRAEHHGADHAVNLSVRTLVAIAGRQRDADGPQENSQPPEERAHQELSLLRA